jgi:hypothetical protein
MKEREQMLLHFESQYAGGCPLDGLLKVFPKFEQQWHSSQALHSRAVRNS